MDASKPTITGPLEGNAILIQRQRVRYRHKAPVSESDRQKAAMSNDYINHRASQEAIDKYNNSPARKIERGLLFVGLPAALSIKEGALSGAKTVAGKVGNSLKTAKVFGVAITGLLGGYKVLDSATKESPGLNKFRKDYPGLTAAGLFGGALGGAYAANPLVNKISARAAKIPAGGESFGSKLKAHAENLGTKLNESAKASGLLENKVFKPAEKFMQKPAGQFLRKHGAPLLVGGVVLKFLSDSVRISHNRDKIKRELHNEKKEGMKKVMLNPFGETPGLIRTEENNEILLLPAEARKVLAES